MSVNWEERDEEYFSCKQVICIRMNILSINNNIQEGQTEATTWEETRFKPNKMSADKMFT